MAGDDIALALRSCADSYANVTATLRADDPDETSLSELRAAWNAHYRDAFARFDARLRADVEADDARALGRLPVSVSSHNLDRLFQVLDGDGRLGDVRNRERAGDLVAMLRKLESLLAATTREPPAPTTGGTA
ncbi:hypothetical protein [Nucisporomicrobium flavum]|uniref:hypothetical protein n=1 Tax=Nucisporomicrobium flavum TaxID=2785915 RepID=UPI0018F382EF|nr:hypothetical protein [Nucisporomicrobium flavum]